MLLTIKETLDLWIGVGARCLLLLLIVFFAAFIIGGVIVGVKDLIEEKDYGQSKHLGAGPK